MALAPHHLRWWAWIRSHRWSSLVAAGLAAILLAATVLLVASSDPEQVEDAFDKGHHPSRPPLIQVPAADDPGPEVGNEIPSVPDDAEQPSSLELSDPTAAAPEAEPGQDPPASTPQRPGVDAEQQALPPTMGVQFHGTWEMYWADGATPNSMFTAHLDQLAAHGVNLLRVDVGWSASQPTAEAPSASNTYNQRLAVTLDAAAARGMRVLLTLHQAPSWASGSTDTQRFPTDPESIRGWATWMAATFGSAVTAWEVWNEPNLSEFTGISDPAERARRYSDLLRVTFQGLRAGNPSAVVVFGGPAQTDDDFIRACYDFGVQPYFDIMSLHPYQADQMKPPESTDLKSKARVTNFPEVAAVMAQYGDAAKPVWWTEFGYSVHSNTGIPASQPWQHGVPDTATSADYLRRQFELARSRYPQITVAIIYTAYKPPSDSLGHQFGYRLMEADGSVLPQLPAMRDYLNAYPGQRALW